MSLLKVLNLPARPHRGPPAQTPAKTPAGDAPADKRYDVKFGRHDLKGATLIEAVRALTAEYQQMRGNCSAEMQAHGERMGRGAESLGAAAVAMISEALGRAEMPSLDIWDPAFAALDRSRQFIRTLSVEAACQALIEAQDAYRKAQASVLAYDGKLEKGGDRAIAGLKVTAAAGAVAAGVATGGVATAAGFGGAATASVGAASAGAYGAAQEFAGQGSEVYLANTRKTIDWQAVLRRGATDAATGLFAGLVSGALTKQFSKMFGSYLGKAITDAELVELGKALGMAGPLERSFFMTTGQKFIAEFLSSSLLVPVQSAITLAINRISGGAPGPKNMEEFMEGVANDVVQGGVFLALVTFLTRKMPASTPGSGRGKAAPNEAGLAPAKTSVASKGRASSEVTSEGRPKTSGTKQMATTKDATATEIPSTGAASKPTTPPTKASAADKSAVKPIKRTAKAARETVASEPLARDAINALPGMTKLTQRLNKANLSLTELGLTEQALVRMASDDPKGVVATLNRLIDIREMHATAVEPKGVPRSKKVDAPHAEVPSDKKWTRIEAVGKTPGKRSSIGQQVIARMRSAGKLAGTAPNEKVFHEPTGKWYPINECDMGHTHDAVTWWNSEGMFHGAKSPTVRKWMKDPAIYQLEPGQINSKRGGELSAEYVAPHPDPITQDELAGKVKTRN